MGDLYYEQLVVKKETAKDKILSPCLYGLAVLSVLAGIFVFSLVLPLALVFGIGGYIVSYLSKLEYEYVFVNGDLDIDKIYAKSRRKKAKSLKMEQLELMAPLDSHRLDHYNQKKDLRSVDYSSGDPSQKRFAMFVKENEGLCRIIVEPDEVLAKTMKNCAPSKIFLD